MLLIVADRVVTVDTVSAGDLAALALSALVVVIDADHGDLAVRGKKVGTAFFFYFQTRRIKI